MRKLTVTTIIDITDDFVEDVLCTCIEGGCINWINTADAIYPNGEPKELEEYDYDTRMYALTHGGVLRMVTDDCGSTESIDLTLDMFLEGIKIYFEKHGVELDAGNIDALRADAIMQYAILGELVYG